MGNTKQYFTYILNKKDGVLYIGVTSDLHKRIWEHKNKIYEGFSKKYKLDKLIYYEVFSDPKDAITREKAVKKWRRSWKVELIEQANPNWQDLYERIS